MLLIQKYTTIKCIEIYDECNGTYNPKKDVRFKTPELRNYLCDWEQAYIVVTGKITVANPYSVYYNKKLALKNNVPFFICITRINNILIDDCQDLDIVMPTSNLIDYSKNYQKPTASLWNYYRDYPSSGAVGNINYSIRGSKSFDYKTALVGKLEGIDTELEGIKVAVPIKYLSKFLRSLEIPLMSCEIFLDLK